MKAINIHINNVDASYIGCAALNNMIEANASLQKEACENGGLEVLPRVLKEHPNIGVVLRCAVVQLELSFHRLKHTPNIALQRLSRLLKNVVKHTKILI